MENNNQVIHTIRLLKKSIIPIVFVGCIFSIASFFMTKIFITPQYQATTQLVGQSDYSSVNDINKANFQLLMVNTYKGLTESSLVLEEAKDTLLKHESENYTVDQIQKMLTVDGDENSQIFTVKVEYSDPNSAKKIAQAVGDSLVKNVGTLLGKGTKLSIISASQVSYTPISPNVRLNTMLGFLLGMLLTVGIIYLREIQSFTLNSFDSISEELGLQNLGNIAHQSKKLKKNTTTNHTVSVKSLRNRRR